MEWIHTLKNGGAFFSFYEVISIFIMVIWTGKFWKSWHRTGVEFSFYLHEVNTAKIFGFLRVFEPRNLKVNEATACMLGLWHTWGECFDVQGTKWWTMGSRCLVEGLSTFTQWTERPLFMEEGMPLSPCFLFFFSLAFVGRGQYACTNKVIVAGWRIGSRRFPCRPVSKIAEGWTKGGLGVARFGMLSHPLIRWNQHIASSTNNLDVSIDIHVELSTELSISVHHLKREMDYQVLFVGKEFCEPNWGNMLLMFKLRYESYAEIIWYEVDMNSLFLFLLFPFYSSWKVVEPFKSKKK